MRTWRLWLQERQAARLLATRGAGHLRFRRLGLSWASWGAWMKKRRAANAAADKAAQHWRLAMQQRALGAMR